jgi:hypothetical protein
LIGFGDDAGQGNSGVVDSCKAHTNEASCGGISVRFYGSDFERRANLLGEGDPAGGGGRGNGNPD